MVPPSEACLYSCINWSLAQAQQQSFIGLLQSFPLCEVANQVMDWVPFQCAKEALPGSNGVSLVKRHHLESRIETHPGGKKSASGSVSASLLMLGRREGVMGVSAPNESQSTASSSSSSSVLQVGMLSHFWINGEALLPTGCT